MSPASSRNARAGASGMSFAAQRSSAHAKTTSGSPTTATSEARVDRQAAMPTSPKTKMSGMHLMRPLTQSGINAPLTISVSNVRGCEC